jgi:peptide chain release factor 1
MSRPDFHLNPSFSASSRENRDLSNKIDKIREWERARTELSHADDMMRLPDAEIAALAKKEKAELEEKCSGLEAELMRILIPSDPNDEKNIILEIRAGAGGDESSLFAMELARMYMRYAQNLGFTFETVDLSESDRGGYKDAVFMIESGEASKTDTGPFGMFKYEMGVHRVQRVPITEASGRIHTSTVTVAVLPEAEEVEVSVNPGDLRIDTYRASGAGGQHINKTDSAVRITHIPSGIVVQCQDGRSQGKNKAQAMKLLRAKLYDEAQAAHHTKIASERKKQVGTGERSEKIRTYNFPQDRITDHRIALSVHNMQVLLDGGLDAMVQALRAAEREARTKEAAEQW